jgi:excinuclease ABC subunit A
MGTACVMGMYHLTHGGGNIVASGTPEEVARCEASHIGRFLRAAFDKAGHAY